MSASRPPSRTRIEFIAHPGKDEMAIGQFAEALSRMRAGSKLFVTIEVRDRYRELRRKLAKRAAKKRAKKPTKKG